MFSTSLSIVNNKSIVENEYNMKLNSILLQMINNKRPNFLTDIISTLDLKKINFMAININNYDLKPYEILLKKYNQKLNFKPSSKSDLDAIMEEIRKKEIRNMKQYIKNLI